jgi:F-type H+-transporting ATPase subunit delta
MPKRVYGRRYAQAVFELALERKELERWQADLDKITAATADAAYLAALESPKIKPEDKARLLKERLGDIGKLPMNLVRLLISRGIVGAVGVIAAEYRRLVDAYHGIQQAEVTTAVPLDVKDKERLAARLGELVGTKVTVEAGVDPEILGGIVARVGGKLLDGSTRAKLAALKKELVGGVSK